MLGSRRLIIQRAVTRLTRSGSSRPELRLLEAAAQTGIVSVAGIRLNSRKFARRFKRIFCDDISEFESYMASQPVRSLCLPRLASDPIPRRRHFHPEQPQHPDGEGGDQLSVQLEQVLIGSIERAFAVISQAERTAFAVDTHRRRTRIV
jgi:hypothetical protein